MKKHQPGLKAVLILAALFFVLVLVLALNRYYSFFASYDQGLFNQLFWNTLRGNLFQSSLSSGFSGVVVYDDQIPQVSYIHLGQHFVIDFLLWLPLYALFPGNATLITLQVGLITAAGLVLYALARCHLQPPLAIMIAASYYGAIAVIGPTLGNFYELCQLPLFAFGLLFAYEKRCWWAFWLLAILTLGVREDAGIALFGIGVYLMVSRRSPRLGLAVCLLSFSYVAIVTTVVMPLFSEDNSRLYLARFFSQFVDTPNPTTLQVLQGIITQPQKLLASLLTPVLPKIEYLLGLWLPLAFIPAASAAAWTIAAFPLCEFLLVQHSPAWQLTIRYVWAVIPGLMYGAILWWSQHPHLFQRWVRYFWIGCMALSLYFTVTDNPNLAFYFLKPDSTDPWIQYTSLDRQWQHAAQVRSLIAQIPADASVSGTTYVIPQVSDRREVARLPELKLQDQPGSVTPVEYVLADFYPVQPRHKALTQVARLRATVPALDQAIRQQQYGILELRDRAALLKRGAASSPDALAAWGQLQQELVPFLQKGE